MARIDELRAEVRKRQQAVNRKLKRYERNGIELSGTEHDPRRQGADISRMRSRDLTRYLNRLDGFMSRRTQFVGDTKGRPIPMSEWRRYKRAETAANRRADRLYNTIKNVKMPGGKMTLGQRDAAVTNTDFPNTANHTVNSPLRKAKRAPQTVANRKALNKLTKQQQAKVDPNFMKMFVNRGRREAYKMLEAVGDKAEITLLKGLSDKQFHILWAYTEYATLKSIKYENGRVKSRGRAEDEMDAATDFESYAWIGWAKQLDAGTTTPPVRRPRKQSEYTDTTAQAIDTIPSGDSSTFAGPINTVTGKNEIKTRRLKDGDEAIISVNGKKIPGKAKEPWDLPVRREPKKRGK